MDFVGAVVSAIDMANSAPPPSAVVMMINRRAGLYSRWADHGNAGNHSNSAARCWPSEFCIFAPMSVWCLEAVLLHVGGSSAWLSRLVLRWGSGAALQQSHAGAVIGSSSGSAGTG